MRKFVLGIMLGGVLVLNLTSASGGDTTVTSTPPPVIVPAPTPEPGDDIAPTEAGHAEAHHHPGKCRPN